MQLIILKSGEIKNSILFNKEIFKQIENNFSDKEILGQIVTNNEKPYKELDQDKVSHIVKNVKYNKILNALSCDIEFIQTPYGEQLYLLNKSNKNKIKWIPIFINYDDKILFITINAEIINEQL